MDRLCKTKVGKKDNLQRKILLLKMHKMDYKTDK